MIFVPGLDSGYPHAGVQRHQAGGDLVVPGQLPVPVLPDPEGRREPSWRPQQRAAPVVRTHGQHDQQLISCSFLPRPLNLKPMCNFFYQMFVFIVIYTNEFCTFCII